ncbi:MAG: FHA domain-containing protein [Pirellulaceae bacterium]
MFGELIPVGGGDTIPLLKNSLLIGRRESCDIVLRFGNVSGNHCQLSLEGGYWFIQDLNSRNGIKVDGVKVMRKRLDPGCTLAVAKHKYEVRYVPAELGAVGPPPDEEDFEQVMGRSLLESAGLSRRPTPSTPRRFDVDKDNPGQLRKKKPEDD